jgi:hypothetical protein
MRFLALDPPDVQAVRRNEGVTRPTHCKVIAYL